MTRLDFVILQIWSALACATAGRNPFNRLHGEWIAVALRAAPQPLPFDPGHLLLVLDPGGRWLHAATTLTA